MLSVIKTNNIESLGYKIGKGIKGKGTEIFSTTKYLISFFKVDSTSSKELIEKMKKQNIDIDELYLREGGYVENGETKYFNFAENYLSAERQYNLQELLKNNFEGLEYFSIYRKPKLLGYFSLSKYKLDKDGQTQMVLDFLEKIEGKKLYGDFENTEYDYDCDCMEFSFRNGDYCNGDYLQFHGSSSYVEDTGDCVYIDGRVSNYNETILDEFWAFGPDEGGWLDELDPNDSIAVYARKGKDWYIGYTLYSRDFSISYKEDGEIIEDEPFEPLFYKPNKQLLKKVVDVVKSWKNDTETKSYVYNQFDENYDSSVVNFQVAEMLFEDINDFRNEVIDNIQKWDVSTIEDEFFEAYHKVVDKKVNILDDKTVEVVYTPFVFESEEPYIKKFNHLKKMNRFGKVLGFEVIHSSVGTSETKAYAIKKDNEEYHFDILHIVAKDISGEQTLREAIEDMLEALEKRKLEMLEQKELFEKASRVFVGIEDSIESGNCKFGTNEFIRRHHINTSKIGGIRGDELLKIENTTLTKRAVQYAIMEHNHAA